MTPAFTKKLSWLMLAIILAGGLTLQILGAWQDSQTFDEGGHLVGGISYFQKHNFAFNNTHPPLTKWLAGTLVVAFTSVQVNTYRQPTAAYAQLLYAQTGIHRAQVLLFLGRLPLLLFWLLLGVVLFLWAKERWGFWAGLLATTFFVFDPTFLGHGHLINTDVPVAAMYVATLWLADRFLTRPSWSRLLWLTVVFGLALATKFSAIILPALLLLLGLVRHWYDRSFSWRWWWRMSLVLLLGGFFIVWATYGFQILHGIPAWDYWRGLAKVYLHNANGQAAYLLGQTSMTGWWQYFSLAILFKTPTVTVLLVFIVIVTGIRSSWARFKKNKTFHHVVPWPFWTMVFPALLWLGISMTSQLNIGLRHILPVYPFLFLGLGSFVTISQTRWWRGILLATGIATIVVPLLAWPNTISYFNGLSGGSSQGYRLLLDSNVDWGQDAWRLHNWLAAQHFRSYAVKLYGSIPEWQVFPDALRVPTNDEIAVGQQPPANVIVSIGIVETPGSEYSWLRHYQPSQRLWSTIWIYHFPAATTK